MNLAMTGKQQMNSQIDTFFNYLILQELIRED